MPYINRNARKMFDDAPKSVTPNVPGVLNYEITKIIHNYIEYQGLRYQVFNEVIGVLECAKLELYRMVVASYEDIKREENGPISELDS
ncbi:MAG: hypothetical protein JRJ62_08510 [Deltaproteobacteria bacterium]|nr:hypothetical protein [Deltaproteobacteria bacterium]